MSWITKTKAEPPKNTIPSVREVFEWLQVHGLYVSELEVQPDAISYQTMDDALMKHFTSGYGVTLTLKAMFPTTELLNTLQQLASKQEGF